MRISMDIKQAINVFHLSRGHYAPLDTFMTLQNVTDATREVDRPNLILFESTLTEGKVQLEWQGEIVATLDITETFEYETKHYVTGDFQTTIPFTIGEYGSLELPSERECVGFLARGLIHKRELAIIQQLTTSEKMPVVLFTTYRDFMHPHIKCLELACKRSTVNLTVRIIPSYNEQMILNLLPRYGCKKVILDKKDSKKWKDTTIEVLTYGAMAYSTKNECWLPVSLIEDDDDDFKTMSTRKYKKMLKEGTAFEEWFTYPEIQELMYPIASKRGLHLELYAADKTHAYKEAQKCKTYIETQIQTLPGIKHRGQKITLLEEGSPHWIVDVICNHNGIVITHAGEIRDGPTTISTEPKKGKCNLHVPSSNYSTVWEVCEGFVEKKQAETPTMPAGTPGGMPPELAAMMGGGGVPGCPTQ